MEALPAGAKDGSSSRPWVTWQERSLANPTGPRRPGAHCAPACRPAGSGHSPSAARLPPGRRYPISQRVVPEPLGSRQIPTAAVRFRTRFNTCSPIDPASAVGAEDLRVADRSAGQQVEVAVGPGPEGGAETVDTVGRHEHRPNLADFEACAREVLAGGDPLAGQVPGLMATYRDLKPPRRTTSTRARQAVASLDELGTVRARRWCRRDFPARSKTAATVVR